MRCPQKKSRFGGTASFVRSRRTRDGGPSEQETDVDHLHDKRLGDTDEVIAEQLQRDMKLSKMTKLRSIARAAPCFIVAVASRGPDKQGTGIQGGDRLPSGQGHEEEQRVLSRGSPFRVPQLTGFNYQLHGSELREYDRLCTSMHTPRFSMLRCSSRRNPSSEKSRMRRSNSAALSRCFASLRCGVSVHTSGYCSARRKSQVALFFTVRSIAPRQSSRPTRRRPSHLRHPNCRPRGRRHRPQCLPDTSPQQRKAAGGSCAAAAADKAGPLRSVGRSVAGARRVSERGLRDRRGDGI